MLSPPPAAPNEDENADTGVDANSQQHQQQAGVANIEAISRTWTPWGLWCAYAGIFLLAVCTSLESQTTLNLTVFATSAFKKHSLVATVYVVQEVVNAVMQPPMAKIANTFGRLEAFTLTIGLYILGYIQQATSSNVQAFASAQIFYSAGATGARILTQVFIADTSDLRNRALLSTLPDLPFLVTVWAGAPLASDLLRRTGGSWRWGYAVWAIVLPVAFLPLALALLVNQRKAARMGMLRDPLWKGQSVPAGLRRLWYELDVMGLLLLSAAISLILVPLTLAATAKEGWRNGSIIAMIVVGCVCLVLFPWWESSPKLAPQPFISLRLLTDRTVLAGCAIGFFYFAVFYTSIQPYFFSYLQVVQGDSLTAAGHITQTFSFTSSVTAVLTSLCIKATRRYRIYLTAGAAIYLLGIGLMIRYRAQGSSTAQIVGTQIAVGIGGGMLNAPAQLGVQASVPHADVAAATAIYLTVVEIGGAVGSAISGAIWTGTIPRKLATYLPAEARGNAAGIFANVTAAASAYAAGTPEKAAIDRSYQETMNILLAVAAGLCVPLLPLSLLMRDYRLDRVDQGVRGNVVGGRAQGSSAERSPEREGGREGGREWEERDVRSGMRKGFAGRLFKGMK